MAQLPTRRDLGWLPSVRSGRPIARVRNAGQAEAALSSVGQGIASLGGAAESFASRFDQRDAYDAELRYQEFQWQERQGLDQAMRSVEPGQVEQFASQWQQGYFERAKTFKTSVSQPFKDEYDQKLFGVERDLFGSALTFQRAEAKRVSVNQITDATENIYRPRARNVPTDQLNNVSADAIRLIEANPNLTPVEKEEEKRRVLREIGLSHLDSLDPDQIEAGLRGYDSFVDKIVGAESSGRSTAKNPLSTATGAGQFIESTWAEFINERHPDLAAQGDVQKLRNNPGLSREAVQWYADKNRTILESAGLPVDDSTLYLAHFAGPQGAVNLLSADPSATAESILGSKVIAANPFLRGKTAGDVIAWAARKMDTVVPEAFTMLTDEDRARALNVAARQREEQRKTLEAEQKLFYTQHKDSVELGIVTGDLTDEQSVLSDPVLDDGDKATLLRTLRTETEKTRQLNADRQSFVDGSLVLNPIDGDDRKRANNLYEDLLKRVPEDAQALVTGEFIEQTGVVPNKVAATIRYGLTSNQPATVASSLADAANIYERAPGAIDNMDGGSSIRDAAAAFRNLTEERGMSAEEAAQRMIAMRSDEFKRNESVMKSAADQFVKELEIGDVTDAFDLGIFYSEPAAGFNPALSEAIMADYRTIAREKFIGEARGDKGIAKDMAIAEMKSLYGPTEINGTPTLMKYPPEKFYPPVNGSHDYLRDEALRTANDEAGQDVSDIYIQTIPETMDDIRAGRLPRYRFFFQTEQDGQPIWNEAVGMGFGMTAEQITAAQESARVRRTDDARQTQQLQRSAQDRIESFQRDRLPGYMNAPAPAQ